MNPRLPMAALVLGLGTLILCCTPCEAQFEEDIPEFFLNPPYAYPLVARFIESLTVPVWSSGTGPRA